MFKQFKTYGLKDVARVGVFETETNGHRINQPPIPPDQGLPRMAVTLKTHRHQFWIRIGLVFGSAHYRDFLALQKLSNAKKNITADEKSTKRRRPVPVSGEVTYLRYSWMAATTNRSPSPRKIPPTHSSHSRRSALRKSAKITFSFEPMVGKSATDPTATNVHQNRS